MEKKIFLLMLIVFFVISNNFIVENALYLQVDNSSWINKIGLNNAWDRTSEIENEVKIAIIDTGIDEKDQCFEGKIIKKYNVLDKSENIFDTSGHGTWIASICAGSHDSKRGLYGVFPNAKLIPIKVTDNNEIASSENVAKGVIFAAKNSAQIINISLGTDKYSKSLEDAINYALRKKCIIVSSAGNEGVNILSYPARYSGVISVGAFNKNEKAFFSNYGWGLDILAPGILIRGIDNLGGTIEKDGTSAATAIVSGAIGIIMNRYPQLNMDQVYKCICLSSTDISKGRYFYTKGKDIYSGFGIINIEKALKLASIISNNNLLKLNYGNSNIGDLNNDAWYYRAVYTIVKNKWYDGEITNEKIKSRIKKIEFCNMIDNFCESFKIDNKKYSMSTSDAFITRSEMLKILFDKLDFSILDNNVYSNVFEDFDSIEENKYKKYISFAFQNGIVYGNTDSKFLPNRQATYAEAFEVLYNMIFYILNKNIV